MDSTNGTYMSYGNSNNVDELASFFDGVQSYASGNNDTPFDSALFEDAFPSQPSQPAQSTQQATYSQAQRQTQSQSPALPQFKATPNAYATTTQQYGQNVYNAQSMAQQGYDQHLLARPTHSPAPFDQYQYQQSMNYAQPAFDYRFNSFQPQRQSTPTQAFRPQVTNSTSNYMNTTRPQQTQAHISQIQVSHPIPPSISTDGRQGSDGMPYGYGQHQRFVTPHQVYYSKFLSQCTDNLANLVARFTEHVGAQTNEQ